MHSKRRKIIEILAVLLVAVAVIIVANSGLQIKTVDSGEEEYQPSFSSDKNSLIIWYTDSALTDYINSVAVNYNSENEDIRVIPVLKSGRDYLEEISRASVDNNEMPDLYVTTNDTLEKAHLAGLANEISEPEGKAIEAFFPEVSLDAVEYKGERIAYPLYFECPTLLYNKTYLNNWARNTLEAEVRAEMADADIISSQVSDSDVQKMIDEYFPSSLDKLLAFSDMYDAPEGVDTIFKWTVTDIFYNYFFIGDSIDVGGAYGDDIDIINIYNEDAIRGLQRYQELNQFFSINTEDVSYDGVMDEFISGKIVMTIATTDAVRMLQDAAEAGNLDFEYGFAPLPDIREGVKAKSMSVTDVVAINGYSTQKEVANDFAAYLCESDPGTMYERTGKVSALTESYFDEANNYLSVFKDEYAKSVPLPKMLETSNFWVNLELLFAEVWDGNDANDGLRKLSEQMKYQASGEPHTEVKIVIQEETLEEDEIIETDTIEE